MSSESDSVSPPLNIEKCSLVLVDVAGTTTSIDFVKDTLFPFVVDKAEAFLNAKWDEDAVKECIAQIREGDQELNVTSAVELIKSLIEQNSPNQGLKTLQGLIYKEGYEKGDLKAHVFEDVSEAFEIWAKNRQIAVYSTGSVDSQKLLFTHTVAGDLSAHISKYFDQSVGVKTEAESYKKIAEETKIPPEEIVFITDDVKEATAAKAGGIHAVLIKRKGNPALPEEDSKDFDIVSSFAELALDKNSKRKIEENANVEAPPSKFPKTDLKEEDSKVVSEKVEEESMEVDSQTTSEVTSEKIKTANEETENVVKIASEKTEIEEKMEEETANTDAVMQEADKIEPQTTSETDSTVKKTTTEEAQPVVEEPESKEVPTTAATTEEKKPEAEEAKKVEETKPIEEITVEEIQAPTEEIEAVVEDIQPIVEEPEQTEEAETKDEPKSTPTGEIVLETVVEEVEEASTVDEVAKEAVEGMALDQVVAESEPEKAQTDVEMAEEAKPETLNLEEKVETDEATAKNGEEKAETSTPKAEEKENKSVLANGVENGSKDESEVDNAAEEKESETPEVTNDDVDNKDDDNEVKVKKLEESAESKTVSVEV